ncbi:MAG: hypothetical protein KBC33_01205 [Candidatus Pacebacteria bacterium]|nr:hypothetical protein [Candidatus Paceibacterota bacterium]
MNFFTKMLVKKQLKGKIPEGEMDKMIDMIEKNPDFFKQMAASIQEKMKSGMSQEEAAMAVMQQDGDQLKKMMGQ